MSMVDPAVLSLEAEGLSIAAALRATYIDGIPAKGLLLAEDGDKGFISVVASGCLNTDPTRTSLYNFMAQFYSDLIL